MRIFQNSGLYPSYRRKLDQLVGMVTGFVEQRDIFLNDRYGALHCLQPVLSADPSAFFTNGDDERLQRAWASENGMAKSAMLDDILLAQIEAHRADVFYNLDPMRYGNAFLARLPGCVKRTIAWRAAPSAGGDFSNHDIVVNNFRSLLEGYRAEGMRAEYFTPAHDPIMNDYAANSDRPIDILFIGGYSRHHRNRAVMLEAVAGLRDEYSIRFHLDRSRLTRLAEAPIGIFGPLASHRRPKAIREVSAEPVFGLDLYHAISRAKIVVNGAIDMSGNDRGNMRCWEAMGCGALLLSDDGSYPEGMINRRTMFTYNNIDSLSGLLRELLNEPGTIDEVRARATSMLNAHYCKETQLHAFFKIVE